MNLELVRWPYFIFISFLQILIYIELKKNWLKISNTVRLRKKIYIPNILNRFLKIFQTETVFYKEKRAINKGHMALSFLKKNICHSLDNTGVLIF